MTFLFNVDAWLINRVFEPIAWRIQVIFGINCFALSRYLVTLGLTTQMAVDMQHLPFGLGVSDLLLITILWIFMILGTKFQEQEVSRFPQFQNPFKVGLWRMLRLLYLVFPLMDTTEFFLKSHSTLEKTTVFVGGFCLIGYIYFASCNPMPPGWKQERRMPKNATLPKAA